MPHHADEVLAVAVHGGAGHEAPEEAPARRAGVERAADAGWAILEAGGSALDAVVAAVVVLEDDPHFNAGIGSVLTEEGIVECDASLMDGETLAAGAVGAVSGIPNPIRLARAVLEEGREVLLVGPAAEALARRHGLGVVDPDALVTPPALRRWRERWGASGETVGAVARDALGHLAAATSTGGVSGKRRGRIGDSAIIGAGTYADDTRGALSATGPGEAIIRAGLALDVLARCARGLPPEDAAGDALETLRGRLGAAAGLVLVDPAGRITVAHTSPTMPAARRGGR